MEESTFKHKWDILCWGLGYHGWNEMGTLVAETAWMLWRGCGLLSQHSHASLPQGKSVSDTIWDNPSAAKLFRVPKVTTSAWRKAVNRNITSFSGVKNTCHILLFLPNRSLCISCGEKMWRKYVLKSWKVSGYKCCKSIIVALGSWWALLLAPGPGGHCVCQHWVYLMWEDPEGQI